MFRKSVLVRILFSKQCVSAFALGLVCWFASVSVAQQDDQKSEIATSPSQVSISPEAAKLGFRVNLLESISKKYLRALDQKKLIGCSVLICKDGKEVYYGQWGMKNQRKNLAISRDTIFRIYSMTKPITSIAALQLVETGKLKLDEPVSTYLPELKDLKVLDGDQKVAPKRPMTVRDLMRHTSGLTYGFFGNSKVDQQYRAQGVLMTDRNLAQTVTKLSKIPLLYQPGTRFHYGVSTDVLGRVIEVVSEQSLAEYFAKNIFKPLGMNDTYFVVPAAKQARMSALYTRKKGKLVPSNPLNSVRFTFAKNEFFSGGGGLCSTIDDYQTFCQMLLEKGSSKGVQLVKKKTIEEMFSNQLRELGRGGLKFGLGVRGFPKGDFGWGGAAGTRFFVHPKKNLSIIYMTQVMPEGRSKFDDVVRDAAYQALKK